MAQATIKAGICGCTTDVETETVDGGCAVRIRSDCEAVQRMGKELDVVDPLREMSFRGERPMVLEVSERQCPHAACPVPAAVIKAVEIASGLALPGDVSITLSA